MLRAEFHFDQRDGRFRCQRAVTTVDEKAAQSHEGWTASTQIHVTALALWILAQRDDRSIPPGRFRYLRTTCADQRKSWNNPRSKCYSLRKALELLKPGTKEFRIGHQDLQVELKADGCSCEEIAEAIAAEMGEDISEELQTARRTRGPDHLKSPAVERPTGPVTSAESGSDDPNAPYGPLHPFVQELLATAKSQDPKPLAKKLAEEKTIFMIAGAFGLSKKALFDYFRTASYRRSRCEIVKKLTCVLDTDRAVYRRSLSPDLYHVTPDAFELVANAFGPDRFWDYTHSGQRYGIPKRWVTEGLLKANAILLICHVPVIGKPIDTHFAHCRRVRAWVFLRWRTLVDQLLPHCDGNREEAKWRVERAREAWDEFIPECVHYRLLSFDAANRDRFTKHLDTLFEITGKR